MYPHAPRTPDADDRIGNFKQKAGAVFNGATISIAAGVGFVLQKLVDQIAIGGMNFHAIKTGTLGVFRTFGIGGDNAGYFRSFEGAWCDVIFLRAQQRDMSGRLNRARRDRQFTIQVDRVGYAPDVPELCENPPALVMHGLGHQFPAFDLLIRPQARRIGIADALRCHGGGFRKNQTGTGALGIIFGIQRMGHPPGRSAAACQRGHNDTVGQGYVAKSKRSE